MSIAIAIAIFFTYALACACAYSYFHRAIGAPHLNEYGIAQASGGMIFSAYGLWLAHRYNRWHALNMQRITTDVCRALEAEKAAMPVLHASLLEQYRPQLSAMGISDANITDAMVEAHIINERVKHRAEFGHFLNPYKALGICDLCTAFWFYSPLYAFGIWGLYANGVLCSDAMAWHTFADLLFVLIAFFWQQKVVE